MGNQGDEEVLTRVSCLPACLLEKKISAWNSSPRAALLEKSEKRCVLRMEDSERAV